MQHVKNAQIKEITLIIIVMNVKTITILLKIQLSQIIAMKFVLFTIILIQIMNINVLQQMNAHQRKVN